MSMPSVSQFLDAAAKGDLTTVTNMLKEDPSLLDKTDKHNASALAWAGYKGQPELFRFLLVQKNANPYTVENMWMGYSYTGNSPFSYLGTHRFTETDRLQIIVDYVGPRHKWQENCKKALDYLLLPVNASVCSLIALVIPKLSNPVKGTYPKEAAFLEKNAKLIDQLHKSVADGDEAGKLALNVVLTCLLEIFPEEVPKYPYWRKIDFLFASSDIEVEVKLGEAPKKAQTIATSDQNLMPKEAENALDYLFEICANKGDIDQIINLRKIPGFQIKPNLQVLQDKTFGEMMIVAANKLDFEKMKALCDAGITISTKLLFEDGLLSTLLTQLSTASEAQQVQIREQINTLAKACCKTEAEWKSLDYLLQGKNNMPKLALLYMLICSKQNGIESPNIIRIDGVTSALSDLFTTIKSYEDEAYQLALSLLRAIKPNTLMAGGVGALAENPQCGQWLLAMAADLHSWDCVRALVNLDSFKSNYNLELMLAVLSKNGDETPTDIRAVLPTDAIQFLVALSANVGEDFPEVEVKQLDYNGYQNKSLVTHALEQGKVAAVEKLITAGAAAPRDSLKWVVTHQNPQLLASLLSVNHRADPNHIVDGLDWEKLLAYVSSLPIEKQKEWIDVIANCKFSDEIKQSLAWKFICIETCSNELRNYIVSKIPCNKAESALLDNAIGQNIRKLSKESGKFWFWLFADEKPNAMRAMLEKNDYNSGYACGVLHLLNHFVLHAKIGEKQIESAVDVKDVNELDIINRTPLMIAIRVGSVKLATQLLTLQAVDLTLKDCFDENAAHYLARYISLNANNPLALDSALGLWNDLFARKPDIFSAKNAYGLTPMQVCPNVVAVLKMTELAAELEVKAAGEDDTCAVLDTKSADWENLSTFLLELPVAARNRIFQSVASGKLTRAKKMELAGSWLLNRKCNNEIRASIWQTLNISVADLVNFAGNESFATQLLYNSEFYQFVGAKMQGSPVQFRSLLAKLGSERRKNLVAQYSYGSDFPVHRAIHMGTENEVPQNPDEQDYLGRTTLMVAVLEQNFDLVVLILNSGKPCDLTLADINGNSIAHYAAKSGDINLCRSLLAKNPRLFIAANANQATPLQVMTNRDLDLEKLVAVLTSEQPEYKAGDIKPSVLARFSSQQRREIMLAIKRSNLSPIQQTELYMSIILTIPNDGSGIVNEDRVYPWEQIPYEKFDEILADNTQAQALLDIFVPYQGNADIYNHVSKFNENTNLFLPKLSRASKTKIYKKFAEKLSAHAKGRLPFEPWDAKLLPLDKISPEHLTHRSKFDRTTLMLALQNEMWPMVNKLSLTANNLLETDLLGRNVLSYFANLQQQEARAVFFTLVTKETKLLGQIDEFGTSAWDLVKNKWKPKDSVWILMDFLANPNYSDPEILRTMAKCYYQLRPEQREQYRHALNAIGYFSAIDTEETRMFADTLDEKDDVHELIATGKSVPTSQLRAHARDTNALGQTRLMQAAATNQLRQMATLVDTLDVERIRAVDDAGYNFLHYLVMNYLNCQNASDRKNCENAIEDFAKKYPDLFLDLLNAKNHGKKGVPGKSPLQILLAQTKRAEVMDFLIRLNDKMPKVKKQGPSQVFNSQRMFAMPTSTDSGMKPISAVHAMVRQSTAKMLHAREKLIYRESATIEQDFSGTASSSEGEKYLAGLIRQKNIAFMSKLDAEINRLTGCNDALSMQKKALFEKLYDIVESNPYVHPRQNTMKWFNDPTVRRIAKGYDQSSDGNPMHVIRQLRPGRFFSWGQLFGWDTSTAHAIIKEYALTAFHGEFQQTYQPVADANGIFPPQYSEDSQRSSSFSQATTLSDSDSGSTSSGPLTGRGFPEPSAPPYDPRYPTI